ncbi:amidohydrolase [Roseburia sp. 1XD42-34]|nr:amidohydrolase [Roseburia sp. 1XD42-34]NBJ70310.1 amidohydrolase [Roseburia sp. 1XD42-34]RKI76448.1 amidohydrolase [Clostridium sp. 1xD42-85]
MAVELKEKLSNWRRDLHQYPETGFLEIRTASMVASVLSELGFTLEMGKEVMSEKHCMGKPDEKVTAEHYAWALDNGANKAFVEPFKEGYTGIVATLKTNIPGPTIAYRFDMDALDIFESDANDHVPVKEGFRSQVDGKMHACGHDAHTAIGLGLATLIAAEKEKLSGTIKLIFQPAEEGTRGAKSMVEANVVTDVDYFIASHIGTGVPHGHFLAANNGFLATSKLDVAFRGTAAHAGGNPEQGKNALLAAAAAVLNVHAISRHSQGVSRVNVGELHAGSGRNIIANHAMMKVETRGEHAAINQYMKEQVESIVAGAAKMYQVDYEIKTVGEAINCTCSEELARMLYECANASPDIIHAELQNDAGAGSEDATYFMEAVQKNGGLATYCIFGTELAAGHHNEKFDIHEATLLSAVQILYKSVHKLLAEVGCK